MRKKHLISAIIIMLVLVIISWITRDKEVDSGVAIGDRVFESVNIDKMTSLNVSVPGVNPVDIDLKANLWTLKQRYDMAVDPSVIRDLKIILSEAKAIQVVPFQDLKLFNLDKNTTTLKVYHEGSSDPEVFRFGKFRQFSEHNQQGRYVYIERAKTVVLVAGRYDIITPFPSVWLKKYLPHHDQIAGISLYYDGGVLWKLQRNSPRSNLTVVEPERLRIKKENLQLIIESALQMRYMDITPAVNDFEIDKEFQKVSVVFQTFAGRAFQLDFLKKQGDYVRCSMKIIDAKVKTDFIKEYGSLDTLRDEISEWHFLVHYPSYKNLFNLN